MGRQVTVSAKVDEEFRKKMTELGIKPSEVIKKALELEVQERMRQSLLEQASKVSHIAKKISSDDWVRAIREGRDER